MQLTGVDLLLTFRCPSQCKHCVYKAGPKRIGYMSYEDIRIWLSELKALHPIEGLTVHGGEPTLYFDTLSFALKTAKKLGIPKRGIITNAYWATSENAAQEKLSKLKQAGLNQITISVDSFHQEFIPFKDAQRGIKAATQIGIDRIWVDSQFLELQNPTNKYDIKTQKMLDTLTNLEGIEISKYQLDFEGRAAEKLAGLVPPRPQLPDGKCQTPYWLGKSLNEPKTIEIDYKGNITLCPGICIGNAKSTPLSNILSEYDQLDNIIIKRLAETGPIGLLELAKEHGHKITEKYVNECHLCYEMRKLLRINYPQSLQPAQCY